MLLGTCAAFFPLIEKPIESSLHVLQIAIGCLFVPTGGIDYTLCSSSHFLRAPRVIDEFVEGIFDALSGFRIC